MKILAIIGSMEFLDTTVSSASTRRVQESLYRNWLMGREESNPEELVNFWLDNKLKPATIKKLLTIYKRWHLYYKDENVNLTSLARKINRRNGTPKVKAWTKEEAKKALDFIKYFDTELYESLIVLISTGLRKGEFYSLRADDINFKAKKINVMRSYGSETTKNGKARSVPMTDKVYEILKRRTKNNHGYLFKYDSCLTEKIKRLCRQLDIREITAHGLRHVFGSWSLDSGKNPRIVAAIMGHSSPSVTLGIYWDIINDGIELDFLEEI